ncbi:hypothetical protein FRB94_004077 [Tulasnella sp. JGI-2019a]|nr:hypothetical protein FRB94_004077 [Tulasnella sp. JGI-2019a]KAG9013360.1 hypothetical protein FRB93_000883 [Tulasnella sp. JGI-2019a]
MFTSLSLTILTVAVYLNIPSVYGQGPTLSASGVTDIPYVGQYQASQYRPTCGTLAADVDASMVVLGSECRTPMVQFQSSPDTYALYDSSTGIQYPDTVNPMTAKANPSGPCMCFSLASLTGVQADVCMIVNLYGTGINMVPDVQMGTKALPQCGSASGTRTSVTTTAPGGANPTIQGTPTSTSTSDAPNASSKSSSPNIGPYGSLIWAPIVSVIGAVAGIYYGYDLWKIKRQNALNGQNMAQNQQQQQYRPYHGQPWGH